MAFDNPIFHRKYDHVTGKGGQVDAERMEVMEAFANQNGTGTWQF